MAIFNLTAQDSMNLSDIAHVKTSPVYMTAGSSIKLTDLSHVTAIKHVSLTGGSSVTLAAAETFVKFVAQVSLTASSIISLTSAEVFSGTLVVSLHGVSSIALSDSLTSLFPKTVNLTAGSYVGVSSNNVPQTLGVYPLNGQTYVTLNSQASVSRTAVLTAKSKFQLKDKIGQTGAGFALSAGSVIHASSRSSSLRIATLTAGSAIAMSSTLHASPSIALTATSAITHTTVSHFHLGPDPLLAKLTLKSVASIEVDAVDAINTGARIILGTGLSGAPLSFAETPTGLVVLANGIDPMMRWSPVSAEVVPLGVQAPATPVMLGGTSLGVLTGLRVAYCRFIDKDGNPSNLSPVSNIVDLGYERPIDGIETDADTGIITIRSDSHGLSTGDSVVLRGIEGLEIANGLRPIATVDEDHFAIGNVRATTNTWQRGGSWVFGVGTVVYSQVPVPSDSHVARRQLLRNLDGNLDTLYVDIDTGDLTSATFGSSVSDEVLATGESVPLVDSDGLPFASRFGAPPSHKSVVVSHSGRIFAACDVPYSTGCVLPAPGTQSIKGISTNWKQGFAGRTLVVGGSHDTLMIESVDEAAQVITYTGTLRRADVPFATYTIHPPAIERKLIYYSEAGNPNAWPEWNVIALPDDGDKIVGLFTSGSYLYAVERRHVYKLVFSGVPSKGGASYLAARRGSISQRVIVQAEDRIFMLDEQGIHSYDGDQADSHTSAMIQTIFRPDDTAPLSVDWSADTSLWHGFYDPARETIRWFVNFVGVTGLTTAICYQHRISRWWIEEYPSEITSSATATIGYRRALVGGEARKILAMWEGALDYSPASGTLTGTVQSATSTSLTDSTATFPSAIECVPVSIVSGTGRGQQRIISSGTATSLVVTQVWDTIPDATSVYQIGGIPFSWRSGWFEQANDQTGNPQDIAVVYRPVSVGSIDVATYFDHIETPRVAGFTQDDDGVSTVVGSPYINMDMTRTTPRAGYSIKRLEGHQDQYSYGDMFMSVAITGVQGNAFVQIYRVDLKGVGGGEKQGDQR